MNETHSSPGLVQQTDHEPRGAHAAHETARSSERASLYIPRILQQHLADAPDVPCWIADGTAASIDISGFTSLSERLARKGREGAEQITEAIGQSFESILAVAYEQGGSLLKFGGDAMLLWFEGDAHAARACRATVLMRRVLRDVGRIELPDARVALRMSQCVHSGRFHFFAVGHSHLELLPVGPAWTRLVEIEREAEGGEILVSPETSTSLPGRSVGAAKGAGRLLLREPTGGRKLPLIARPKLDVDTLARCLAPSIRAHVLGNGGTSEHRPVTIAFIRFAGTDNLIKERGPAVAAQTLHDFVSSVQSAADEHRITFLASDVDADGGKIILTAGAPRIIGNDEERMLLAIRAVLARRSALPIRIGVNRGAVFAGDVGPFYRRTYTVMGDAVNVAARLMASAEPGHVYATADVLNRSDTLFQTTELEPFFVKGKSKPVRAWSVGPATRSRTRDASLQRLPLIGREGELRTINEALDSARRGSGCLIEIVGEAGVGKTRVLEALFDGAADFRQLHGVCEAYTTSQPYAIWTELLRELMHFGRDDADAAIAERLRAEIAARAPDLLPWLPLIAIAFGLELAPTPEVELLAETNRRKKLNEVVCRFLELLLPDASLIGIENAHHMDPASAELLAYVVRHLTERRWIFGIARRPSDSGFAPPATPAVLSIELAPLGPDDALRMTRIQAELHPLPLHVLETVAKRSGGNPQFLSDLLRAAIDSGGTGGLPDSVEAAAMARIDALAPEDRALVRRAAVFGLTFHPRMLSWLYENLDESAPGEQAWARVRELFDEEPDGYLRFRRSLWRDAAYEGLPYKSRRRLHGAVAARLEAEMDNPEEGADILSLHYLEAGDFSSAWRYAAAAAKRAQSIYAYVEAAALYSRAIEASRRFKGVENRDLSAIYESQAYCRYRTGEYRTAADGYAAAYRLASGNRVAEGELMLMRSRIEEKLGHYSQALRWAARARKAVSGLTNPDGARQAARTTAWYAVVLQTQGRTNDALRWTQRALIEAEAADDPEAMGEAHNVMGQVLGQLGKDGAQEHYERSIAAYERSGNLVRQAGVLANMGLVCQREGRWDEALSYYERGRDGSLKVGNTIVAGVARINIAEILIERGEFAEAEQMLLDTMQLWKASQYPFFLGASFFLLGRASLRAGRCEEALQRLEHARANFLSVHAQEELPAIDTCIAECRMCMGQIDAALTEVNALLKRSGSSSSVARLVPSLKRVRAHALLERGDSDGARRELEASLVAARQQKDLLETMRTLLSLVYFHRVQGSDPPSEVIDESNELLETLRIRVVPAPPAPLRETSEH